MTARLGDFLTPAGDHIAAAVAFRGELPGSARDEAIAELGRVVSALARYIGDLPAPEDPRSGGTYLPGIQAQATADAQVALRRAAGSLRPRAASTQDAHPVVQHLSAAAGYLSAGRDLLQTHFSTGRTRGADNSYWAPTITSEPVTSALLSELASHARVLAPWAAQLTMASSADLRTLTAENLILHHAIGGLWITATAAQAAQQNHPLPGQARQLLNAVPAAAPPFRLPLGDGESVTQLCHGITISAERLRHAARSRPGRWSPAATSAAWRRAALACAITSHASDMVLRTLTDRAAHLGIDNAITSQLRSAADTMSQTWPAWRTVTCEWDILRTGTSHRTASTPAATDLGDLALRTGRLAYANPDWTPDYAEASTLRGRAALARTRDDIPAVIAAIHHAADAITRIAARHQQAVRTAASERRLYLPTRLMPEEYDIHRPYTLATSNRTDKLLATYTTAINASTRVTEALDELAATTGAPSAILGIHRGFARLQPGQPLPASADVPHSQAHPALPPVTPDQGTQIELLLHRMHITEPAMLLHAAAIDQATTDLLEEATAKSHNRTGSAASLPQVSSPAPCQPANLASQDLPHRAPGTRHQATRPDHMTSTATSTQTVAKRPAVLSRPGTSP
jgi:hypothetical protein